MCHESDRSVPYYLPIDYLLMTHHFETSVTGRCDASPVPVTGAGERAPRRFSRRIDACCVQPRIHGSNPAVVPHRRRRPRVRNQGP